MRKTIATFAFIAALALTGCGNVTQSANINEATTAATTQPAAQEELKLIGEKTSDSSVCLMKLTNKTNKDIVSISIKSEIAEKFSANMIDEKDPFIKNEKRLMYFIPEKQKIVSHEDDEHISTMGYTIKIEFADKTSVELHQFPYKEIDEASLFTENNVAYLEYTTKEKGEKVSTKEAEKMFHDNEKTTEASTEAATEAQTEAQAAEEPVFTPAYEEPVNNQPVNETPVYTQPATEYVAPATQAQAIVETPSEPAVTNANPNGGCTANSSLWD